MENNNDILQDKLNALGSDTIMGSMEMLNNDTEERLEKLQDAVEKYKDEHNADEATTNGAITGDTLEALAKTGYFRKTRPIVRDNKKIGRNDKCPCGSGKKYKNCCMNAGKYETTHYE